MRQARQVRIPKGTDEMAANVGLGMRAGRIVTGERLKPMSFKMLLVEEVVKKRGILGEGIRIGRFPFSPGQDRDVDRVGCTLGFLLDPESQVREEPGSFACGSFIKAGGEQVEIPIVHAADLLFHPHGLP